MRRIILVAALAALVAAGAAVAADQPTATATICTSVKDRAPVGAAETFPPTVGELYCLSEVTGGSGTVVHAWFHGDKEVFKIELPVKAARWRTWSAKKVPPAMTGDWRVEVRDAAGTVLATGKFSVK